MNKKRMSLFTCRDFLEEETDGKETHLQLYGIPEMLMQLAGPPVSARSPCCTPMPVFKICRHLELCQRVGVDGFSCSFHLQFSD